MELGPPVKLTWLLSLALILMIGLSIVSSVNGEWKDGAGYGCRGTTCIPKDDCKKANSLVSCGEEKVCCVDTENKSDTNGNNETPRRKFLKRIKNKKAEKSIRKTYTKSENEKGKKQKPIQRKVDEDKKSSPKGKKCKTTTSACKALGGTCGKKGSCSVKAKRQNNDYKIRNAITKAKANGKDNIILKKGQNKGKPGPCGFFCDCCLPVKPPVQCPYKPSTPACDARGGSCMMRSGCDYQSSKEIITDECDGRQKECFECCSPAPCSSSKKCLYRGGQCKEICDIGEAYDKKGKCKGGCQCCIPIQCTRDQGGFCSSVNGMCVIKKKDCKKPYEFVKKNSGCTKTGRKKCKCCYLPATSTSTTTDTSTTSTSSTTVTTPRYCDPEPEECKTHFPAATIVPIGANTTVLVAGPPFSQQEIEAALTLNVTDLVIQTGEQCSTEVALPFDVERGVLKTTFWKDARIPFTLAKGLKVKEQRELIRAAMDEIERKTCLTFPPKEPSDRAWVHIQSSDTSTSGTNCYADEIGDVLPDNIPNIINLEWNVNDRRDRCSYGTTIHELLHVAGFAHEHTRQDRDNFVCIIWDNIEPHRIAQFCKRNTINTGHRYDYGSVMHYHEHAFDKDAPTRLITIDSRGNDIGQRRGMSQGDVDQVNHIYNCP